MPNKGAKALIVYKGKFLFILRDDKPGIRNPNVWNLAGGAVEEGENLEEGMQRELREEICVVPEKIIYIGKNFVPMVSATIAMYIVPLSDTEREQVKLGNEGQKLDFFAPEEVLKLPLADTKDYFISIYPALVRIANGETIIRPEELYLAE